MGLALTQPSASTPVSIEVTESEDTYHSTACEENTAELPRPHPTRATDTTDPEDGSPGTWQRQVHGMKTNSQKTENKVFSTWGSSHPTVATKITLL